MNNNIDMGKMTSKEIGDLMSKALMERGKEVATRMNPTIDYGSLPSKTLTTLGKESLSTENVNINNK